MIPSPILRVALVARSISGSGYRFASMTSSRNRTASWITAAAAPSRGRRHFRRDEPPDVDAPERARLEREQRLLAAGVCRLDWAEGGGGLELVDPVDEHHARIADRPRGVGDRVEDTTRIELTGDDLDSVG